jgi:uroporphyrinogen-III synthase
MAPPLQGKTVLTTRPAAHGGGLRGRLEALGARVVECPAIAFAPTDDWTPVDRAIDAIDSYRWLIFTSANAVGAFFSRLRERAAAWSTPIAVVGPATAESLARWNRTAALVPEDFHAEGLLAALPEDLDGTRILFPRAETARETLPEELRRRGAVVDVVTVYRTIKDPAVDGVRGVLARERIDCVAFTSSSTVRFFCEGLEDGLQPLEGIAVAVIGPVTRRTAEAVGMRVAIEPSEATAAALAEAIAAHFAHPDH